MSPIIRKILAIGVGLALMTGLVGCQPTTYTKSDNIIEALALSDVMGDSGTVVIDARSAEDYQKGHLEGAINLPPSMLSVSEPVAGLVAPLDQVEQVLGSFGITNESHVYVYDNNGGVYAGRIWWVLKLYGHEAVTVINNGESAIVKAELPLTKDVPSITTATYVGQAADEGIIASLEEVQSMIESQAGTVLDVRSQSEYDEGAIPGALLHSHSLNLYNDGSFKSARDIFLDYNDLGLDRDEPIILYCKTSFRATQTMLLLTEAGYTNVKVYDGAWVEWSTKDMPKEEAAPEQAQPSSQDAS